MYLPILTHLPKVHFMVLLPFNSLFKKIQRHSPGLTQLLSHPKQPFHILAIWGIPCILGLRAIVVDSSSQGLQSQHANTIGAE